VDKRKGHIVINNLIVGEKNYARTLLITWQPELLCKQLDKPQLSQFNHNIFVRSEDMESKPLFMWSPAANNQCQQSIQSPEDLNKLYPEFSGNSLYIENENEPLFKSSELGNYQLLPEFPGTKAGVQLSEEIRQLIGFPKNGNWPVGAYPLVP
jgi:hypothetical protein